MLGHGPFYNKSFRKYIIAFAKMFENIVVVRSDQSDGATIKVPLAYVSKQKYIYKYLQGKQTDFKDVRVDQVLPRMTFILESIEYDQSRARPRTQKVFKSTGDGGVQIQYQGVPYNLNLRLSILTASFTDLLMIVEQILPFFNPTFNLTVFDNPLDDDNTSSIPLKLVSTEISQEYEGLFDENRQIVSADLLFSMQGNLFGPATDGKQILHTIINMRDLEEINEVNNIFETYLLDVTPTGAVPIDEADSSSYTIVKEIDSNE